MSDVGRGSEVPAGRNLTRSAPFLRRDHMPPGVCLGRRRPSNCEWKWTGRSRRVVGWGDAKTLPALSTLLRPSLSPLP